jgi:hypothetical protein
MRFLYYFAVAMLLAILLPVLHASAFTIDSASGTNADGSSRFVDPDEQIHSSFFGGSAVNEDGWADRNFLTCFSQPCRAAKASVRHERHGGQASHVPASSSAKSLRVQARKSVRWRKKQKGKPLKPM